MISHDVNNNTKSNMSTFIFVYKKKLNAGAVKETRLFFFSCLIVVVATKQNQQDMTI
jgi:hypothetical protein